MSEAEGTLARLERAAMTYRAWADELTLLDADDEDQQDRMRQVVRQHQIASAEVLGAAKAHGPAREHERLPSLLLAAREAGKREKAQEVSEWIDCEYSDEQVMWSAVVSGVLPPPESWSAEEAAKAEASRAALAESRRESAERLAALLAKAEA